MLVPALRRVARVLLRPFRTPSAPVAKPWDAIAGELATAEQKPTAPLSTEAQARFDRFLPHAKGYKQALDEGAVDSAPAGDVVTTAGVTFLVPADERKAGSLADRIIRRGWLPLEHLCRTRATTRAGVMIDIGANIGTTSIPRVLLGDCAAVYAIEPAPANFAALVYNIHRNGLAGRIMPDQCAIGSATRTTFMRLRGNMSGHKMTRHGRRPTRAGDHVKVKAFTLDDWVARMGVDLREVTFIKCDTQGAEGHILRGATQVLAHKHIAWQMEIWPAGLDVSGVGFADLSASVAEHFETFRMFATDTVHPAKDFATVVSAYLTGHARRFTDVLLMNGGVRAE